jgi:ATP/maltotriose-dependent transcriptional regulator MalT
VPRGIAGGGGKGGGSSGRSLEDEVYLFLDDYHWITNGEVHNALAFLLKYVPTRFHLALTTRVEPALPLARLRARLSPAL